VPAAGAGWTITPPWTGAPEITPPPQPQPVSQPESQPHPRLKKLIFGKDNFRQPESQPQSLLWNLGNDHFFPHESQELQVLQLSWWAGAESYPHESHPFLPKNRKPESFQPLSQELHESHEFELTTDDAHESQPPQ